MKPAPAERSLRDETIGFEVGLEVGILVVGFCVGIATLVGFVSFLVVGLPNFVGFLVVGLPNFVGFLVVGLPNLHLDRQGCSERSDEDPDTAQHQRHSQLGPLRVG